MIDGESQIEMTSTTTPPISTIETTNVGSSGDDCNYAASSDFLLPLLEGYCAQNNVFASFGNYGSAMAECSPNGQSAVINLYQDSSCNNLVNFTAATTFSCGNSQQDCFGLSYQVYDHNQSDCGGFGNFGGEYVMPQVENICVSAGFFSLLLDIDSDSIDFEIFFDDSCNDTSFGTGNITEECRNYGDNNSTSIRFYPFEIGSTSNIVEFFVDVDGTDEYIDFYSCDTAGCSVNKTWYIYGECENPELTIRIAETDFNSVTEYAQVFIDGYLIDQCTALDQQCNGTSFVLCSNNFNQRDISGMSIDLKLIVVFWFVDFLIFFLFKLLL